MPTTVDIADDQFHINGQPTYPDRTWEGHSIEGRLLGINLAQALFDDSNPNTRARWVRDGWPLDPKKHTIECTNALPEWKNEGLNLITLNLQGASPDVMALKHDWKNTAYNDNGTLKSDYARRLGRLLREADKLEFAILLGLFHPGQAHHLESEDAVIRALDSTIRWLCQDRYQHIMLDIAHGCDSDAYQHQVLQDENVFNLFELARKIAASYGVSLKVTASCGHPGQLPHETILQHADFIAIHGHEFESPDELTTYLTDLRSALGETPKPILISEDLHQDFTLENNHCIAAISQNTSWCYTSTEDDNPGSGLMQPPVDWKIADGAELDYCDLVRDITGT